MTTYPVHVDASLQPGLSRGLWLVKWLLAIPHYVVLAFLWLAFVVLSIVAFFAILFTGRYPRGIFDFNVGVLRWSWRVTYYAYGALGTDRYPPFTLSEVPEYPAHLEVEYPTHLSRGLVLVKWWLLAIPHYIVVGIFVGGGTYAGSRGWEDGGSTWLWSGGGLIGLLVLVAAVVLLFTGRYPASLFDLVLGLNRWVLRVAAYAGLMTDDYPPFRLDLGGTDPGSRLVLPVPPDPPPGGSAGGSAGGATGDPADATRAPGVSDTVAAPPPSAATGSDARDRGTAPRWSAGRVIGVVVASLAALVALALVAVGGTALVAAGVARDDDGYLMSAHRTFTSSSYAIASPDFDIDGAGAASSVPQRLLGDVKVDVSVAGDTPVFVGIGRTALVDQYLRGIAHSTVLDVPGRDAPVLGDTLGGAPRTLPGDAPVWAATSSGTGDQTLKWPVSNGRWTVVVMNADGSQGIDADVAAGATVPALTGVAVALLVVGLVLGILSVLAITLLVRRRPSATPSAPVATAPQ